MKEVLCVINWMNDDYTVYVDGTYRGKAWRDPQRFSMWKIEDGKLFVLHPSPDSVDPDWMALESPRYDPFLEGILGGLIEKEIFK